VESDVEGPFDEEQGGEDAERIREMIRRRIQNLPRGLQNEDGEEPAAEDDLPGQEMVEPGAPRDFFEGDAEPGDDGFLDSGPADEAEEDDGPTQVSYRRQQRHQFVPASYTAGRRAEFRLAADREESGPAVKIRLQPTKKKIGVGDRFDVAVQIDASQRVSHLPITLRYNDKQLQVLDVWSGDFIGSDKESQFLAEFSEPGRIVIGASRLGNRQGVQGQGAVAYVRFRALTEGRAVVRFEKGKALDRALKPIQPLKRKKAVVHVGPEGAGTEPLETPELPGPPDRGEPPLRG
jgi:hypothetical protein